jgi:hypothetical protein
MLVISDFPRDDRATSRGDVPGDTKNLKTLLKMRFFRDCGRGLVVPTVGSSVLVRQPGGSSCTKVHSGSRQSLHALFYLWGAEPLHPCSRPRGAFLHLLPWVECMTVLQEQKNSLQKNHYFKRCP